MYFTETPSLREIEKAMKMVPNFTPRGHGVVILCKHEFAEKSCIGDSQKEILARTVSRINNPLFQKRFQKYINESETIPVNFRNSKHSTTFTDAIKKKNKRDYALMSALYLLTAEFALWQTVKRYIVDNSIDFKSLQPAGISENGYTLLCAAKDLYLGTDYLTISDLADTQLIPPRMFALILEARRQTCWSTADLSNYISCRHLCIGIRRQTYQRCPMRETMSPPLSLPRVLRTQFHNMCSYRRENIPSLCFILHSTVEERT